MAQGDGGSVIFVSSTASQSPGANVIPYGAAKAGVNNMTVGFARALAPKVRVNCIIPGPFLTDISKAWDMKAFEQQASRTILLRRGGQPNEIVGAALYFASDASSFTTGSHLVVSGGSLT
jgi:NAD(P)-dependent dehydrogenase (short-subunit alcohol dehydrogenase family)